FGTEPAEALAEAGFDEFLNECDLAGAAPDLDALAVPVAVPSRREGFATVYPRFAGYHSTRSLLGPSARWVGGGRRFFEVPLEALPVDGVDCSAVVGAAEAHRRRV